jgi:hypothetical protein
MRQYTFAKLAAAGLLAIGSATASADGPSARGPFGYETDYVLNPAGREVPQPHAGVGSAFGFDADTVPSGFERKAPREASGGETRRAAGSSNTNRSSAPLQKATPWSGYNEPAFGKQFG